MAIISKDRPIDIVTDVRKTLELPDTLTWNKPGRLCASNNVNKWSLHKPLFFQLDGKRLTTVSDRGKIGGFSETGSEFLNIKLLDYVKPLESRRDVPYRLKDFVGYDHNAKPPLAAGTTVLTGPNQSSPLTIGYTTPSIGLRTITDPVACNAICVIESVSGGHSVVGYKYLTNEELTSNTPKYYQITVDYWTPSFSSTTTFDRIYYIALGVGDSMPGIGGVVQKPTARYIIGSVNSSEVKATATITVRITASPNNPAQWSGATVTFADGLTSNDIQYDFFKYWFRSDAEGDLKNLTKVQIGKLRGAFPSAPGGAAINIDYKNPNTNQWVFFRKITLQENESNKGDWGTTLTDPKMDIKGFTSAVT